MHIIIQKQTDKEKDKQRGTQVDIYKQKEMHTYNSSFRMLLATTPTSMIYPVSLGHKIKFLS